MKRIWLDILLPLAILLLGTTLIAMNGADLSASGYFYRNGSWPVGDQPFWHFLYVLDRVPAGLLCLGGLGLALYGRYNSAWRHWRKGGAFIVLVALLGPGLLVNSVFKEYWGRPRPREIVQFGGHKPFLHPWQKGVAHHGRSFPSGHASAAFYMTAPYFPLRRRRPRLALAWMGGGLAFGILMSIARIAQGGHFLSDNLWAWGVVHLTAVALYYLMRLDREPPPAER